MALFFNKKKKNVKSSNSILTEKQRQKILVKANSLIRGISDSRENLSFPEYDLSEIKRASESDSYIKIALMKYSYMLFKAGYKLKSENEAAKKYIQQRFYIMSFATDKPIDILFQEIGDDLIRYSNAFLVKTRVDTVMPGINAKGFFSDKPIGGYFRIDPDTVVISRDKYGNINKYIQVVDGEEKKFAKEDVIHFYLDKDANNAFGTPRIIAAIEDVKLLRRIEGNIMAMIYRFSMPLYQMIIGLPQQGFQATNNEIDEAKNTVENMSLDGFLVTNEKTNIKVLGAEGNALDAKDYLDYFEKRVFTALDVSESQMGRGGAKQDADSMESQTHDTVKHIQKTFSIFVENYIINELLLEGGFNPVLNEKDRVSFVFNEINIDTKIKVENHEMAKYQSNMTTFQEMRRDIGRDENADLDQLYKNLIDLESQKTLDESKCDQSIRLVKATKDLDLRNSKELSNNSNDSDSLSNSRSTGNKKFSPNGNGTNKSQDPNNDVTNKNTPENQYGKTSVKIKESLSNKNIDKECYININKYYNHICQDVIDNVSELDTAIKIGKKELYNKILLELQNESFHGMEDAKKDISNIEKHSILLPHSTVKLDVFKKDIEDSLNKTFKDIKEKIKKNGTEPETISSIFEAMKYRIKFLLNYTVLKAYWHSYLSVGKSFDYDKAYIDFDDSKDQDNHKSVINLNNYKLEDIPPFHPFCDCKIIFKKGEK